MKKPRVFVAEFKHETNCFSPNKAGMKEYAGRLLKESDEVIPCFIGTRTEIGGMIEVSEDEEFEIIPIIAASATPSGLTTKEVFDFVKNKIVQAINNTKDVDGILLALHGAMVCEDIPDAEGELLKAIRNVAGSGMPIVVTLDLHGNVTETMMENASAFFPYENYPHTDGFERGYEAGKCIVRMMRREISPVMKFRHIPIIAQTIETASEPHVGLLKKIHKWEENPKVINVAVMHGFPLSDIPDVTMSVMAITDDDSELAEDIIDDMAKTIWEKRDRFQKKYLSPEEAVREAMEFPAGPVIIADAADNPGGGGTGDTTFVLRTLIGLGVRNVGLAFIPDPESVEQAIKAGVGSKVKVSLGGKLGPKKVTGGPLDVVATVKTIADGQFFNKGPMMKGVLNNIGRTVVLDIDGIEVIVAERRIQPYDAEIFRRVGIEPNEKRIIVLKSAIHYKASFGPMAKKILDVDTPAYHSFNFWSLDFKNIVRPVYPLDKDFEYVI